MTEYFRHLFHHEIDQALDGIAFHSSKKIGGVCYTLFFDHSACADNQTDEGAVILFKRAIRSEVPKASSTAAKGDI